MIAIRRLLQQRLQELHPRVYFQRAASDAQFPYLVWELPTARDEGQAQGTLTLELNGWDDQADSAGLEQLMAVVREGLDGQVLVEATAVVVLHHETTLPINIEDDKVHGRKLTFHGRIFRRS